MAIPKRVAKPCGTGNHSPGFGPKINSRAHGGTSRPLSRGDRDSNQKMGLVLKIVYNVYQIKSFYFSDRGVFSFHPDAIGKAIPEMGLAATITCVILLYNANLFVLSEIQTGLIRNISLALSSYFHINCFVIFQRLDETPKNLETFRALSAELKSSVAFLTFEDRRLGKVCSKPMNLIIGEELKQEFSIFTYRESMADEIWVVFLSSSTSEFFRNSRPSFDSEVVAAEISNPQEVRFREVYSVDNHFPLRIVEFGNWSSRDGWNLPKMPLYERRSDLEGKVLRVGSNENWPICSLRDGKWEGYMPRIWKEIETLINCTTVPIRSKDGATGLEYPNKTWNGLMGMLVHGEIDVIAAELSMTKKRVKTIDFGYPALNARYQIYFRALGYRLQWKAIFRPLAPTTWIALLGWIIIGSLCLSVAYYWYLRHGFQEIEFIRFDRTESFFFMLQSLCQQGYPFIPRFVPCRILFLMAYALSTVMIPSYSASLISSLTHRAPLRPFDSLEEMVLDGRYNLLVKRSSASFTHFSEATEPLYEKAFLTLVDKSQDVIPLDDSVRALNDLVCKKSNNALYGVNIIVDLKMEYRKPECYIIKLSEPLFPVVIALGMRKDSPYSRIVDYKLLKLQNTGCLKRMREKFRPLSGRSPGELHYRQVEVQEIFQVFVLLLGGIIISIFLLLVEKSVHNSGLRSVKGCKYGSAIIYFDMYMD